MSTATEDRLRGLLREALEHITEKPWDDDTHLHARISRELGLPIQYADHIKAVGGIREGCACS
jgi:hypothetical protein